MSCMQAAFLQVPHPCVYLHVFLRAADVLCRRSYVGFEPLPVVRMLPKTCLNCRQNMKPAAHSRDCLLQVEFRPEDGVMDEEAEVMRGV